MNLLRVTARMETPLVRTSPLNLSGLVVQGWLWLQGIEDSPHRGGERRDLHDVELLRDVPLARVRSEGRDVQFASDMLWDEGVRVRDNAVKRRTNTDMEILTRTVHRSGGPWKDMIKPLPLLVAPAVHWWAVGDADGVRSCLERIEHLGAYRAHGHGRIRGWEVATEADTRNGLPWLSASDKLLRSVPATWVGEADAPVRKVPVTVPFWDRRLWVMGYGGGVHVSHLSVPVR